MWDTDDDDPNDPNSPDFDLSDAGIDYYRPAGKPWFLRRWVFLVVGVMLLFVMFYPLLRLF